MDAAAQQIEPQYLSLALSRSVPVRIGQMNKTEHAGIIRAVGRYEINLEENGVVLTIPKQDISFLTAPEALVSPAAPHAESGDQPPADAASVKPNIQHEFLDKAIRDRHPVTVFLLTGQRVKATIEAYDNFTILVRENARQTLYYKHAVSTINR